MATEKWNPANGVTTTQILSLAYCTIFCIFTDTGSGIGHYWGQRAGGRSEIDYAHFDGDHETRFDPDNDFFEATTEDGCEGCWIRVELVRWHPDTKQYTRKRVGTIKTLDEGRMAWNAMGALAGELAYLANNDAAHNVLKRAKQLAAEAAAETTTAPDHSGNA